MRAVGATLAAAFREAFARRAAFWSQVVIMVLNDLAWVVFWAIYFHRVPHVRGWDFDTMLLLQATLTTGGGIVLGFLSNARRIGQLAADGQLDAALLLPTPTLPHLLVREVRPVNLGDCGFGLALFLLAGHPTPARLLTYALASVAGAVVFVSFLVATGSVAFFTGRGDVGTLGFNAMILLASYPAQVFTGTARALLYVAVPAAFVAAVPAQLIADPQPDLALALAGAATATAFVAWVLFTTGLRRYTSGATWTRA